MIRINLQKLPLRVLRRRMIGRNYYMRHRSHEGSSPKIWAIEAHKGTVQRSKVRGWPPPDFDTEFLLRLAEQNDWCCELCGKKTHRHGWRRKQTFQLERHPSGTKATLDCVDPRGPYTKSGVAFLCHDCNRKKSDLTMEFCDLLSAFMRKRCVLSLDPSRPPDGVSHKIFTYEADAETKK